jgi:hypothetical protein
LSVAGCLLSEIQGTRAGDEGQVKKNKPFNTLPIATLRCNLSEVFFADLVAL